MFGDLHPAWKVCIGMAIVLFVTFAGAGRLLLMQQQSIDDNAQLLQEIQNQQRRGEERGYINRAIGGCSDIINDGEIEITEECTDPRVAVYYPPSICNKLPIEILNCGDNAVVVTGSGGQ